jgi:type II secretory pathway component PulM
MDFGMYLNQIAVLVAAFVAFFAAMFAASAPSKKDLKRLENQTAEVSARIARVEGLIKRANEQMKEKRALEAIEARYTAKSVSLRKR